MIVYDGYNCYGVAFELEGVDFLGLPGDTVLEMRVFGEGGSEEVDVTLADIGVETFGGYSVTETDDGVVISGADADVELAMG